VGIAERVLGRDRERKRAARRGAGRGANQEVVGGGGTDGDGPAGAGDRTVGGVSDRQRLLARRPQGGDERAHALVHGRIDGQGGLGVAAGEVEGAVIARGVVVELVLGGDREDKAGASAAGGGRADREVREHGGGDGDGGAGAGDGTVGGVGGRHRLVADGDQG